jgi:hypothetical protein
VISTLLLYLGRHWCQTVLQSLSTLWKSAPASVDNSIYCDYQSTGTCVSACMQQWYAHLSASRDCNSTAIVHTPYWPNKATQVQVASVALRFRQDIIDSQIRLEFSLCNQLTSLKKPLSTSSKKRAAPFGAHSGCTSTTIVPVLSGETCT